MVQAFGTLISKEQHKKTLLSLSKRAKITSRECRVARRQKWMYPHATKQKKGAKKRVRTIHECQCQICLGEKETPEKTIHHQINVVLSRLDEQQRRWYAAVEANRYGSSGAREVSKITGLDEKTIRRGQKELSVDLVERPNDRIRLPGGGRQQVEKKTQASKKN